MFKNDASELSIYFPDKKKLSGVKTNIIFIQSVSFKTYLLLIKYQLVWFSVLSFMTFPTLLQ